MMSRLSAVALVALLLAGCASGEPAQSGSNEPRDEPTYRTGSNIRLRDPKPLSKEEKERQAEEAKRVITGQPGT